MEEEKSARRGPKEGDESSLYDNVVTQIEKKRGRARGVAAAQKGNNSDAGGSRSQPDLLFVTYRDPKDQRSRIRSHVMLHHARKKRHNVEKQPQGSEEDSDISRCQELILPPEIGGLDAFGALSVTMTRPMSRLFHHYVTTVSPLHYPPNQNPECNPMNTRWVSSAIRDPALLQSTLCSAAGHLALLEGAFGPSGYYIQYLIHKSETIRIVNGRISDHSLAITDETLGAIALLVTDQVVDGDYKEMAVHMRGLAKLVNLRGGLPAMGMNGLLAGEIQWCDIITAFMTNSLPQLPLKETQGGSSEEFSSSVLRQFVSEVPSHSINPVLRESSFIEKMSQELVEAFWDMSTMTAILNLKAYYSEVDMLVYDRKRASIQHRLARNQITCPKEITEESQAQKENELCMQESCRMAGVIFSNLVLWGFQPPMRFYGDLAIMLQQALSHTDLENHWDGGVWEDILLWVLILGGDAALTRPERAWFVELLSKLLDDRGFYGFEDVKAVLVMVMYQDCLDDAVITLLREVNEFKEQVVGLDLRD